MRSSLGRSGRVTGGDHTFLASVNLQVTQGQLVADYSHFWPSSRIVGRNCSEKAPPSILKPDPKTAMWPSTSFAPCILASLAFKRENNGRSPAQMRGIGKDNNATANRILLKIRTKIFIHGSTYQQIAAHPFLVLA